MACQEVYELSRAREWTAALTRWCEQQPDVVAFTGRCLVHRAEIMQLRGAWAEALEEARRAGVRFAETLNRGAGQALYRQGEILRLRGDFAAAEEAYRGASRAACEPQPGLAQLRLAQGRARGRRGGDPPGRRRGRRAAEAGGAPASLRRDHACRRRASRRRGAACHELEELAESYDSDMLGAMAAQARGAVELAEGDARGRTRRRCVSACELWQRLEAPYEAARVRVLIGPGVPRARRRGHGRGSSSRRRRAVFAGSARSPTSPRLDALGRDRPGQTHG